MVAALPSRGRWCRRAECRRGRWCRWRIGPRPVRRSLMVVAVGLAGVLGRQDSAMAIPEVRSMLGMWLTLNAARTRWLTGVVISASAAHIRGSWLPRGLNSPHVHTSWPRRARAATRTWAAKL